MKLMKWNFLRVKLYSACRSWKLGKQWKKPPTLEHWFRFNPRYKWQHFSMGWRLTAKRCRNNLVLVKLIQNCFSYRWKKNWDIGLNCLRMLLKVKNTMKLLNQFKEWPTTIAWMKRLLRSSSPAILFSITGGVVWHLMYENRNRS